MLITLNANTSPTDLEPPPSAFILINLFSELKSISDVEFTLTEDRGRVVWTWGSVKRKNQFEILKMLDEGNTQSDVAKALGVDRSYVNRVKNRALKDGYLFKTGKLTENGYSFINSSSEDEEN